jgi:hypothetical protein
MGNKEKPETLVKWIECPEDTAGDAWSANIQAPSDDVELPDYPQWHYPQWHGAE